MNFTQWTSDMLLTQVFISSDAWGLESWQKWVSLSCEGQIGIEEYRMIPRTF